MRKVTLSFKSTKKDTALYNFVMSMDDKSYSIKEALRAQFADEINKYMEQIENEEYIKNQNKQITERLLDSCYKELR